MRILGTQPFTRTRNPFLGEYNHVISSESYNQTQKREFVLAWKRSFQYKIEFTAGDWVTVLPVDYYQKGE
jgi:hypothetical protein